MKLNKQEQRYRAKQQLANKFTQKSPYWRTYEYSEEVPDENAVRKLINKVCK